MTYDWINEKTGEPLNKKKMVDGKIVNLTKKEITARDKEEEQELIKRDQLIQEKENNENKKLSGKQKLKDLGLDDDEINALLGV